MCVCVCVCVCVCSPTNVIVSMHTRKLSSRGVRLSASLCWGTAVFDLSLIYRLQCNTTVKSHTVTVTTDEMSLIDETIDILPHRDCQIMFCHKLASHILMVLFCCGLVWFVCYLVVFCFLFFFFFFFVGFLLVRLFVCLVGGGVGGGGGVGRFTCSASLGFL